MIERTRFLNNDYPCSNCMHDGDCAVCDNCYVIESPSGKVSKPVRWESKYGRKKAFDQVKVPDTLADIVRSIIADYDRRKDAIAKGEGRMVTLEQYAVINESIDDALLFIEDFYRYIIFDDMKHNRGYDYSKISTYISRKGYYRRKRKIIAEVATNLNLI